MTFFRIQPFSRVAVAVAVAASTLLGSHLPARADASGDVSRRIVSSYGGGAVTMKIVLKSSMSEMGESQSEREIDGIVLNSSGLIVTSNINVDPMAMYGSMGSSGYTTKVVSVKILAPGGEEIPARVVLRDKDRNLAFLRPIEKPKTPLPAITFGQRSAARIGDSIFVLGRLGKTGGRQSSITSERVVSVIQKPRLMYVILPNSYTSLGNAVFNESGQPLGLLTARMGLKNGDSPLAVVVPVEDVLEIARQAPATAKVRERVVAQPAKNVKASGKTVATK